MLIKFLQAYEFVIWNILKKLNKKLKKKKEKRKTKHKQKQNKQKNQNKTKQKTKNKNKNNPPQKKGLRPTYLSSLTGHFKVGSIFPAKMST